MNPWEQSVRIKLDLFCLGLRLHSSCEERPGARPILRTRAGLGSGLEMVLPGRVWVNAPVLEPFAQSSPYELVRGDNGYFLHYNSRQVSSVQLPPEPLFYNRVTRSGRPMRRVGVLQGTYLAVYPGRVCDHWTGSPRQNCRFCSVGLNVGQVEEEEKTVSEVIETALAAREECGVTFVHFNTGYEHGDGYLDRLWPFIEGVRRYTGLLVGVQAPPHPDLSRYDALAALGVDQVSFCLEFWDPEVFTRLCPGKAANIGRQRYLDAMAYCAGKFATANGEIIAGPEPVAQTMAAIEWMTQAGVIPTVCVFRPLLGTEMEKERPPAPEALRPLFGALYQKCMERGLPLGIAPNLEVSIIVHPEEGRAFSERPGRYWSRRALDLPLRLGLKSLLVLRRAQAGLRRKPWDGNAANKRA